MKKVLVFLVSVSILFSCSPSDADGVGSRISGEWSVPINEVLDGGPGRDGIPALINPDLINGENVTDNFLEDSDLVIGYKNGDEVMAYPHIILDWHEIINDNVGDVSVAITYCPLTGTGIGWNRILNGNETTFGVSGLLYNTNLIPFDRATNSNWSQILNEAVNGDLLGDKVAIITLFETNWGTWKALYPNTKVVSTNTGFSRTYGTSPYGDYNTNNNRFFFPVPKDNRLPLKERVHTILAGGNAKVYQFSDFDTVNIIEDSFEGANYLIVGNQDFMVSFELGSSVEGLEFSYIFNNTEAILSDNEGNEWNIFGEAISGPRTGQFLKPSESFMAFWFSIPAFYNTEIYGN